MKNKGFTIVELMAVIVILGILSSMAMISVSKYRKDVRDTDLVELHQTIDAAYDKYRQDNLIKGASYKTNLTFEDKDMNNDTFNTYFSEFTFDGKRLTKNELKGSVLNLVSKGELLSNNDYKTSVNSSEEKYVEDGACLVESTVTTITKKIKKSCKKDSDRNIMPSQEEILCIVIKRDGKDIINDYSSDKNLTQRPLCKYLTGTITQGNN